MRSLRCREAKCTLTDLGELLFFGSLWQATEVITAALHTAIAGRCVTFNCERHVMTCDMTVASKNEWRIADVQLTRS